MSEWRPRCKVCRVRPAVAKKRCERCYRFFRRHGVDRPEELRVEQALRAMEREQTEAAWGKLAPLISTWSP